MRILTIVLLVVALPVLAEAKNKVAIAPIDGDKDGSVAKALAEAASGDATVTSATKTGKQIEALSTDTDDKSSVKKLRTKMGVDAVVVAKVEKSGTKKHLSVTVYGKKRGTFELDFKTTTAKSTKKELAEKMSEQIAAATGGEDEEEEEARAAKKKKEDEEAARKKKEKEDEDAAAEDKDKKKKQRDKDKDKDKVADGDNGGDGDGDTEKKHKRKKRGVATEDGEEVHGDVDGIAVAKPITQQQVFAAAGVAGIRRTLTYTSTGAGAPPAVATGAGELELDAEGYLSKKGTGLGVAIMLRQAVGLGIAPPGGSSVGMTEAEYRFGARFRIASGSSAYSFGLDYWRRREIADRSGLATPMSLDMPDADYLAVAPNAQARFGVSPKAAVFINAELPYVIATGPMGATFPAKGGLGFCVDGGVDYALAARYALRFAATFDQVSAAIGSNGRNVNGLTDRAMGISATVAMTY